MKLFDVRRHLEEKYSIKVSGPQVYYWEIIGLLGKISRGRNDRRNYNENDVKTITFIALALEMNMSLYNIQKLLVDKNDIVKRELTDKISILKTKIIPALEKLL